MSERTLDQLFERIYYLEGVLAKAQQLAHELEWQMLRDCHHYLKLTKLLGVLDKTSLTLKDGLPLAFWNVKQNPHPENGEEKQ
jgi:hypothetical protein